MGYMSLGNTRLLASCQWPGLSDVLLCELLVPREPRKAFQVDCLLACAAVVVVLLLQ